MKCAILILLFSFNAEEILLLKMSQKNAHFLYKTYYNINILLVISFKMR